MSAPQDNPELSLFGIAAKAARVVSVEANLWFSRGIEDQLSVPRGGRLWFGSGDKLAGGIRKTLKEIGGRDIFDTGKRGVACAQSVAAAARWFFRQDPTAPSLVIATHAGWLDLARMRLLGKETVTARQLPLEPRRPYDGAVTVRFAPAEDGYRVAVPQSFWVPHPFMGGQPCQIVIREVRKRQNSDGLLIETNYYERHGVVGKAVSDSLVNYLLSGRTLPSYLGRVFRREFIKSTTPGTAILTPLRIDDVGDGGHGVTDMRYIKLSKFVCSHDQIVNEVKLDELIFVLDRDSTRIVEISSSRRSSDYYRASVLVPHHWKQFEKCT